MTRDDDAEAGVLLVEDNPNDLELTLRAFERSRVPGRIDVARDGAEALDYVFCRGRHAERQSAPPCMVLLDLKLPLVGGLEVLQQLKANPRTRPIPVVVLTSSREERDVAESYQLGANSYVVKPLDFTEFVDAVRQLGVYWLSLNERARP